jgi:hypothetical protein
MQAAARDHNDGVIGPEFVAELQLTSESEETLVQPEKPYSSAANDLRISRQFEELAGPATTSQPCPCSEYVPE